MLDGIEGNLAPWEGPDELAEVKAAAMAARVNESASHPQINGPGSVPNHRAKVPPKATTWADQEATGAVPVVKREVAEDLPELAAYVRELGRVNSVMVFKDLEKAGYLVRLEGRYQQCKKKAGKQQWFLSFGNAGRHELRVTVSGQALLKTLKRNRTLTKVKTPQPLKPHQQVKRATKAAQKRALKAKLKAAKATALAASQSEVMAELDRVIEASASRRAARRMQTAEPRQPSGMSISTIHGANAKAKGGMTSI